MRKKIILAFLILFLIAGFIIIKNKPTKQVSINTEKQINLEGTYKIPSNVSYNVSENSCNFKPSNDYPILSFRRLDDEQIKAIAQSFKLTTSPKKGRFNGQIISAWNEKGTNVNIIPFPAKVEYFNKAPNITRIRKKEDELLETAISYLKKYTETEYELAKIEYQRNGNLDLYTKTNFENANFIKITMTLKGLNENIFILPDFKPLAEVVLFPDGEISSLSLYLFDIKTSQNKFNLLKCPDDVLKNINSSTVLALNNNSEGIYDNLDPRIIKSVTIQNISLVYLIEPSNEVTELGVKPFFEVQGTIQTTGKYNGTSALIYLKASN